MMPEPRAPGPGGRWLALALLLAPLALRAGPPEPGGDESSPLLGICSAVTQASCGAQTQWSVAESPSTPSLNNPNHAGASFTAQITEGATTRTLQLDAAVTLDGLIASGTNVDAIFLSLQRWNGAGYVTVASAVTGDPSSACGCPYVPSSMSLSASAGSSTLAGAPLLSLASGAEQEIDLRASWDLAQGLIAPGDSLRVQPCVAYSAANVSGALGC